MKYTPHTTQTQEANHLGLTLARTLHPNLSLAKVHTASSTETHAQAKHFEFKRFTLPTQLDALASWLEAQSLDSQAAVCIGEYAEPYAPRARRLKEKFGAVSRGYLFADVDDVELPFDVNPGNPDELKKAALYVRDALVGGEWRDVECVVQWTGTAFQKDGQPRPRRGNCRLVCYLDRPYSPDELRSYLKAHPQLDASVALVNQLIMTASPIFDGLVDPLAWRVAVLPGTVPRLTLPTQAQVTPTRTRRVLHSYSWQRQTHTATGRKLDEWLTAQLERVEALTDGRNDALYLLARTTAPQATAEGCAEEALARLVTAVERLYADSSKRDSRLASIANGWEHGLSTQKLEHVETIDDVTHRCATLKEGRALMPELLREAVERTGTTVVKASLGVGKTRGVLALLAAGQLDEKRVLYAAHSTVDGARKVYDELRKQHSDVWFAEARNASNCPALELYTRLNSLSPGEGTVFCKLRCREHMDLGGSCLPPVTSPPDWARVVITTHANAPNLSKRWAPDVYLHDEDREPETLHATEAQIDAAVDAGEIVGDSSVLDEFVRLLVSSYTEKICQDTYRALLSQLSFATSSEHRRTLISSVTAEQTPQPDTEQFELSPVNTVERARPGLALFLDAKILEALADDGTVSHVADGRIVVTSRPVLVDAPTRVVLDGTVEREIALAVYGEGLTWVNLLVEPNEHVTHVHIHADTASRSRTGDAWHYERTAQIVEALDRELRGRRVLWVGKKSWGEAWPYSGEYLHYRGPGAVGSNEYQDYDTVVLCDFKLPRLVLDSYARALGSPRLKEAVVKQYELAAQAQAGGRLRLHSATSETPKTVITLGSEHRLTFAKPENTFVWSGALAHGLLCGGVSAELFAVQWRDVAQLWGGVWSDERDTARAAWKGCPCPPFNLRGLCDTLSITTRQEWNRAVSAYTVKVKCSSGVLTYLPPQTATVEDVLDAVERRAFSSGWVHWAVEDGEKILTRRNLALEQTRASTPAELVEMVSRDYDVTPRTVRNWLRSFGGWDAYEIYHRTTTATPDIGEPMPVEHHIMDDGVVVPVPVLSPVLVEQINADFEAVEAWARDHHARTAQLHAQLERYAVEHFVPVPFEDDDDEDEPVEPSWFRHRDEFLSWCLEFNSLHGEPPDVTDVREEWGTMFELSEPQLVEALADLDL